MVLFLMRNCFLLSGDTWDIEKTYSVVKFDIDTKGMIQEVY